MQRLTLGILAVILAGCGANQPPIGVDSSSSTRRTPAQESPLQPGTYTGELAQNWTMTFAGPIDREESDSATTDEMITIGPSGLPLTDEGEEIYVGYTTELDLGLVRRVDRVESVSVSSAGVVVRGSLGMTFFLPGVAPLRLTGASERTYRQTSPTTIEEAGFAATSGTSSDGLVGAYIVEFEGVYGR